MSQMYIIYVKDSIILIQEGEEKKSIAGQELDNKYVTIEIIAKIRSLLESNEASTLKIQVPDPKKYLKKLKQDIRYIKAAGGLIKNDSGAYLFIFRRGKWDLPKGKIDAGERPDEAALREVEEECGLKISEIKTELDSTYHFYLQDQELILKRTHWFRMRSRGEQVLIPQESEDITEARFIASTDLALVRGNTFASIEKVMQNFTGPRPD